MAKVFATPALRNRIEDAMRKELPMEYLNGSRLMVTNEIMRGIKKGLSISQAIGKARELKIVRAAEAEKALNNKAETGAQDFMGYPFYRYINA
jgi:hypothetical protein